MDHSVTKSGREPPGVVAMRGEGRSGRGTSSAAIQADRFERLQRMLEKSVVDRRMTTGAEARVDFKPLTRPLKRRSSTVAHAFATFSAACSAAEVPLC